MGTTNLRFPDYREFLAPQEPYCSLKWRVGIIDRCKWFSNHLWHHWYRLYEAKGYRDANLWLCQIKERFKLGQTGLSIDATDSDIHSYAKVKAGILARDITEFFNRFDQRTALGALKTQFERTGLPFPVCESLWSDKIEVDQVVAGLARIQDQYWLRRQLRTKATRQLEQLARELGIARAGSTPYISDFTMRRVLNRKMSNRKLLEKLVATNDLGQTFSLADLADKSISNPINRRMELMTRLDGMEQWAEADHREWQPAVFTITAPSQYHPLRSLGNNGHEPNPKYNGSSPRETQELLMSQWAKSRAQLDHQGIEYFGCRVTEPHHDGTPHWHVLLYILRGQVSQAGATLRRYALEIDPHESGAQEHRFQAIILDKNKGRATGYLAKYISKNIDGYGLEKDEEGQLAAPISAIRVACWASTWGIRQFQTIGEPPITPYRALRKLSQDELTQQLSELSGGSDEEVLRIHQAADAGNFNGYIEMMGGASSKRSSLPLRAFYFVKKCAGKYGQDILRLRGLITRTGELLETQIRTWIISMPIPKPSHLRAQFRPTGPPSATLEFCQ